MPTKIEIRLTAWLNWRNLKWANLTCKKRAAEIAAMKEYYEKNPNVSF